MKSRLLLVVASWLTIASCQSQAPYDYSAYEQYYPRSILILPPVDETIEVNAGYRYLSTLTVPLTERGYYVFPVAIVDRMMRENGITEPVDMHAIPLDKLAEIFNPDAVLYITLSDWGTEYMLLDSQTRVSANCRLVDVESGQEFWGASTTTVRSSSSGQSSLVGMLASALVNQITTSISDPSLQVAREANSLLFLQSRDGLLLGERHPGYAEQRKKMAAKDSE